MIDIMFKKNKQGRWREIFTVITIAALFVMIYALRHQILGTIKQLPHVNIAAILLIIPLEIINYHAQTKVYQGLFKVLDEKIRYRFMYRVSLEMNFVNNLFPSGGVTGFSYFSVRMKAKDIPAAKSSLVQLMKLVIVFLSFQILLVVGLFLLAVGGKVNELILLITGSIVTLLLVSTFMIAFIVGSKQRIDNFLSYITRIINNIVHIFRPKHPETINLQRARLMFADLHTNYQQIRNNLKDLKRPLVFGIVANITEISAIYVVYVAFGHWVNPGAVIIAYAIANFAGLVSVLPGGVGIYEALMTGVLATAGVPAALSLPVTVMYRVVNMVVQMPPGYILYQKALHAGPVKDARPI
ncbi:MAG: hypothetical protein NVSMB46_08760 [Candidatus Saccharimonadales bacterium]